MTRLVVLWFSALITLWAMGLWPVIRWFVFAAAALMLAFGIGSDVVRRVWWPWYLSRCRHAAVGDVVVCQRAGWLPHVVHVGVHEAWPWVPVIWRNGRPYERFYRVGVPFAEQELAVRELTSDGPRCGAVAAWEGVPE